MEGLWFCRKRDYRMNDKFGMSVKIRLKLCSDTGVVYLFRTACLELVSLVS